MGDGGPLDSIDFSVASRSIDDPTCMFASGSSVLSSSWFSGGAPEVGSFELSICRR